MDTIAFLGCSRGLGRAVSQTFAADPSIRSSLLVARDLQGLKSLGDNWGGRSTSHSCDFSQSPQLLSLLDQIHQLDMKRVFYFAGGGPHGPFTKKQWKDHQWGIQVSFLSPAEILHRLLSEDRFRGIEQIIFVGSAVADNAPDSQAASYAAAKHGLKGLITSIVAEGCDRDLRYFRPGYMDTDLLPLKSKPRGDGSLILPPQEVAETFYNWAQDPKGASVLSLPSS